MILFLDKNIFQEVSVYKEDKYRVAMVEGRSVGDLNFAMCPSFSSVELSVTDEESEIQRLFVQVVNNEYLCLQILYFVCII